MKNEHFVAWDIGGAHLKFASVNEAGEVVVVDQLATPIWKGLSFLEEAIPEALNLLPKGKLFHAVTMTAELVDIFDDRSAGINTLISLCEKLLGKHTCFYELNSRLVSKESVKECSSIASANWHASASYISSKVPSGLFIDIGSTTTDITLFNDGSICARGTDDHSRLRFDELVYTGVVRTSLMSLTQVVPFAGEWQNITAEHFATTADIYRILALLDEQDDLMETADGNDKNIECSTRRVARMVGADADQFPDDIWVAVALYFKEVQLQLLTRSVLRVLTTLQGKAKMIVGAGAGRFLVKEIAQRLNITYLEFSELCLSEATRLEKCNTCAPAVALAYINRNYKQLSK